MKSKKCATPYCRNDRIKGKTKCSKCNMRWYKEHHPIEYAFNVLRSNAKRRGKEFNLTIDEFRKFCRKNDYIELKGKAKDNLSIDRDKDEIGYTYDNIKAIPLTDNVKKQRNIEKEIREFGEIIEDIPF